MYGRHQEPSIVYAKGALFVFGGAMASALILAERPTIKVALLLAIAVWCFARAYYFAFYVDPALRRSKLQVCGAWVVCFLLAAETPRKGRSVSFTAKRRTRRGPRNRRRSAGSL